MKEVLAYLDDIIIGTNFNDHLYNLIKVFDRLRLHDLKLNAKKCNLFALPNNLLGKIGEKKGVSVSLEKISSVLNWLVPQNV